MISHRKRAREMEPALGFGIPQFGHPYPRPSVPPLAVAAILALAQDAAGPLREPSDGGARAEADGGTDLDGGTARPSPEAAPAELAKKAVVLANIHLQAARLYVVGLFQLSRKPAAAWDR